MNQDQVKERLLSIRDDVEEFSLIFSGKKSKKVHGLYHPDTREIIIHNRNFEDDNELMYTAIHEFAHHVHFTTSAVPVGPRAHNREFRGILHALLIQAEQRGVYINASLRDPELAALTTRIKEEFLTRNGKLMKEFGAALIQAEQLCRARGARFEDYVERVLSMDRSSALTLMKMHSYDVDPAIGYENMAMVARESNPKKRQRAQEAFREGQSPDTVKTSLLATPAAREQDPVRQLERERKRIQRTIASLQGKLEEIEGRLSVLSP